MSEDTKAPAPTPEPSFTLKPSGPVAPVVMMKGGTSPSSYDRYVEAQKFDHQQRLAVADAEKREASKGYVDGPDGAQGAVRKSIDLGQPHLNPVAVLQIVSKGGGRERFIVADITEVPSPDGLSVNRLLVVVCPECVSRGVPQAQCQLTINDSHRKWFLNESTRGVPFRDPDTGEVYVTAGTVEGPDLYKCSNFNCTWAFRISSKSDYPGVSRIVRE